MTMADYVLAEAGQFRANPHAVAANNIRLLDPDTPGTPETDTLTSYDAAAVGYIDGIRYTGKDGTTNIILFFDQDFITSKRTPKKVLGSASAAELQEEILKVISLHEVNAVVAVSKTGTSFTISHTGSGTITHLVVDGSFGAGTAFSRAAVSGAEEVSVALEEPAGDEEKEKKGKSKKK